MRLVVAIVLASALFGQLRVGREIDGYLELTNEQRARVDANIAEFARQDRNAVLRQVQLFAEIQRESNAEPLNPAALDVRYAEQETLRRESAARRKRLVETNVAVLTAAQRQKLAQLQESQRLAALAGDARAVGLLDSLCAGLFGVLAPSAPSGELVQYLRLTQDQLRAMTERQRAASRELLSLQMQIALANTAFARANAAEPLDPQAIGDIAVRRERLQRDFNARLNSLQSDNRAALTA
ncbi:MAG: hypothetical protein FJW38_24835 [Acidobacteria bacterium]|nr:hypothetical protein [Acidobacteriota bacterium]